MEDQKNKKERLSDLISFTKNTSEMIAKNTDTYQNYWMIERFKRDYTLKGITEILSTGSTDSKRKLSNDFFKMDGFYKNLVVYYATLLRYMGLLIPNPGPNSQLSEKRMKGQYKKALDFIEDFPFPVFFTNIAQKVLVDGNYYGLIQELKETGLSIIDLPQKYCRSNFKDLQERDLVEFNLEYFDSFKDKKEQEGVLRIFPKTISRAYRRWRANRAQNSQWVFIPIENSIFFNLFDDSPFFLHAIPSILQYHETVDIERERDLEEIRKIIVQRVPHLNDGELLFETVEAEEMHRATSGMLGKNPNVSVLTTYADVEAITSKTGSDLQRNSIEKMLGNIYNEAGVSGHIFSSTGSATLKTSIKNDISLMFFLAQKFSIFLTDLINNLFANDKISFKYSMLPLSLYNEEEYIANGLKMASQGYSFLVPALASGFSQRDLSNIKDLENTLLELEEKLIPLSSSHTQSGGQDGPGRPVLPADEKSPKTLRNEESLDNTTGGSN